MKRTARRRPRPRSARGRDRGVAISLLAALWSAGCSKEATPQGDSSAPAEQGLPDAAAPDSLAADSVAPDLLAPDLVPPPAPLQAGAASVTIDFAPLVGVPLGGYGARRTMDAAAFTAALNAAKGNCVDPDPSDVAVLLFPSEGTHDPITIRSLVLQAGPIKAAIVKIDAIGVSAELRNDVTIHAQKLGISPQHLALTATHTHSGPAAMTKNKLWQLIAMDCFHQGTYDKMVAQINESLDEAHAKLAPARLGMGIVEVPDVTHNRAGRPGVVDRELGLIRVEQTDGTPLAAVLNFAIHGTCLGEDNLLFSGDVTGYAERALDDGLGVVTLFLNGAQGDVSPTQGGFDGAEAVGQAIAAAAQALWDTVSTEEEIVLAGSVAEDDLPPFKLNACQPAFGNASLCDLVTLLKLPVETWMPTSAPFAALRISDVALAMVPGEPITDIGTELKAQGKALGFSHTFVVGLANEHLGYFTTATEYAREDSYEAQSTMYGPGTGQRVVDALTARMKALKP